MLRRNYAFATLALVILALAAGSAFAQPAQPQRTFVASYGNDTWPCSLPQPCRTFQAAINAVAATGEVVALDSAGYGAMEIHKSVSVIVPPGIHAGLSPATGLPLPGYPGQTGVVLIDIQDTDVVVLRGLNINHQGTVTGGIEWISSNGGTVYVEDVVVNGFPKEGIYVQVAPFTGTLHIKNSIFRNNGVGIYGGQIGGFSVPIYQGGGIYADHVHIEKSGTAAKVLSGGAIHLTSCEVTSNGVGFEVEAISAHAEIIIERCKIANNPSLYTLNGTLASAARMWVSGSHFFNNGAPTGSGLHVTGSYGNNVTQTWPIWDATSSLD